MNIYLEELENESRIRVKKSPTVFFAVELIIKKKKKKKIKIITYLGEIKKKENKTKQKAHFNNIF